MKHSDRDDEAIPGDCLSKIIGMIEHDHWDDWAGVEYHHQEIENGRSFTLQKREEDDEAFGSRC